MGMNTLPNNDEFLKKFLATKAWWLDILGGSNWPERAQEQWPFRALAYLRSNFHDFFDGSGPGPMDVFEYFEDGSMQESTMVVEPPSNPLVRVLREAVVAAGLQGAIQLHMELVRWPNNKSYQRSSVAVLDWEILPLLCRKAWEETSTDPTHLGPDKRSLLSHLIDASRGEDPLEDFIHAILYDVEHPLASHILKAMASSKPGGPVPLWRAWCRYKGTGGRENVVSYHEIPQYPVQYIDCNEEDILMVLDKGIVLDWPENGMRIRVRLPQPHDLDWVNGESFLHFEPTTDPLTELTNKKGRGGLRVFGLGYSQQTDRVPVVDGKKTVCLFSWGQYDSSTTIMVSLEEKGLPDVAWVDGSCT